jgi:hypothetical protein
MNQPPVVLTRDGIGVFLAQKANIVRIDQLVNRRRIPAEFAVVELNRPLVLLAAMHRLNFFVALDGLRHPRRGDGQPDQNQRHQEQHCDQDVSVFARARAALCAWAFTGLAQYGH